MLAHRHADRSDWIDPEEELSMTLLDLLIKHQMVVSRSDGRRLIVQGAVTVDGKPVPFDTEVAPGKRTITVGKKKQATVLVENKNG